MPEQPRTLAVLDEVFGYSVASRVSEGIVKSFHAGFKRGFGGRSLGQGAAAAARQKATALHQEVVGYAAPGHLTPAQIQSRVTAHLAKKAQAQQAQAKRFATPPKAARRPFPF